MSEADRLLRFMRKLDRDTCSLRMTIERLNSGPRKPKAGPLVVKHLCAAISATDQLKRELRKGDPVRIATVANKRMAAIANARILGLTPWLQDGIATAQRRSRGGKNRGKSEVHGKVVEAAKVEWTKNHRLSANQLAKQLVLRYPGLSIRTVRRWLKLDISRRTS